MSAPYAGKKRIIGLSIVKIEVKKSQDIIIPDQTTIKPAIQFSESIFALKAFGSNKPLSNYRK